VRHIGRTSGKETGGGKEEIKEHASRSKNGRRAMPHLRRAAELRAQGKPPERPRVPEGRGGAQASERWTEDGGADPVREREVSAVEGRCRRELEDFSLCPLGQQVSVFGPVRTNWGADIGEGCARVVRQHAAVCFVAMIT